MKKIYLSFLISSLFLPVFSSAQHVQWLESTPINFNLNPELTEQPIFVAGNKIYAARMVDFALNYGVQIFGSMAVDRYDTSGALVWSFPMGPKVAVESITADATGNVYISGGYMETLSLNGSDSLVNTGVGLNTNLFLLSLDAQGVLRWKRNVTLTHADAFSIPALTIDPQNNCWYGCVFFDSTTIQKLDAAGNDLQSHLIHGTRTLGNFSFDPAGNMFLAGSTGFLTLDINGFSVNVPEPYMMFVARINSSGNTSWIQLVHDVTFQLPRVAATANGDAYVSGNLMDSADFGTVSFRHPQWVYDIFLTKVDSAGNFSWGVQVPETPNITGDFQRGKNNFMDVDASGNVYITGTLRGSVDWGNGVITNSGSVTNYGSSIISFDNTGTARWQVTGTAAAYIAPYSICVTSQDECYFSASISGATTFDSLTTNLGGNYAFLLGKISRAGSTGINHVLSADGIKVFPNPAKGKLAVSNWQSAKGPVSIYNMLGEMMFSIPPNNKGQNSEITIDVSDLPSGIYLLDAGNARTRFVVQH